MDQVPVTKISEVDKQRLDAVASIMNLDNKAQSIMLTKAPKDLPSDILGDESVPKWVEDTKTRENLLDSIEESENYFEQEAQMLEKMEHMSNRLIAALRARGSASLGFNQTQNITALEELSAALSVCSSQSNEMAIYDKDLTKSLGKDWIHLTDRGTARSNTETSKRSLDNEATTGATTARKRRPIANFSRRIMETTSSGQAPSEDPMDLD